MAYYAENLSGKRLQQCYEVAPPRVKQYLRAEIDHIRSRLCPEDHVLELGCGYGRVMLALAREVSRVVGIDTAIESITLGRQLCTPDMHCEFIEMDATAMTFPDAQFDVVICVQNGICAFGVEKPRLVKEAVRVCRSGGRLLFSSYAEGFWPHRLEWFQLQAAHGLIGEIDMKSTGKGIIVCKDGFRAGFMQPDEFRALWEGLGLVPSITVVDDSAVFCESVVC
ncbi:MAG: class I SAM-dependent methyltransferase [Deltaproteobacteria bacterium]|nr:class I SAM-dependent methyltransferase [Deltaproteobacteria bacterium]